jgi:manganese/iron transport system substrate-binding protein
MRATDVSSLLTRLLLALAALALAASCTITQGGGRTPANTPATISPATISVVATTTVFADLVRQVGGERVEVHSLIPAGHDVHTFDPAPSDIARLAAARLLVLNGLGLDDWVERLAEDAAPEDVRILALGEELEGVEYLEGEEEHGDEEEEPEEEGEHGVNPHLWLDVSNARLYAERISAALVEIDPAGQRSYEANAAAYDQRLADLDGWIRQRLEAIPAENRRIVSFHDAFPYFARAYGLEVVGVVVASPGQEPSAGEVTRLISAIREAEVKAILTEIQFNDRLALAIAEETEASVIEDLYSDALGDHPLDTFEEAMRWNADRIAEALR